jgi:alpha-ketoglutaric semialdehyde dehydrogenase
MANNFKEASVNEINQVMQKAQTAFEAYQQTSIEQKSGVLRGYSHRN